MTDYYSKKLAGERLQRCYEIASPRVKQYLEAEIQHVLERISPDDCVLELGCGYGRVALRLAAVAREVVGIDVAGESLILAGEQAREVQNIAYFRMDALQLAFDDNQFDMIVCVQNGICAFGVDRHKLVNEALRVTRRGGLLLFSTYTDEFWPHRLEWFERQSEERLLGPIDHEVTGNGVIACTDGFRSGRLTPADFGRLCKKLGLDSDLTVVDNSSLFCEIRKP